MDRRRLLAAVSTAQLATGVAGMAIAVRHRHPYDFLMLHGRSDRVVRDSVLMGTALSAPVSMLTAQAIATVRLVQQPSASTEAILAVLGGVMVVGYLGESLVRQRLRPSGWQGMESPLAVSAIALSAAMPLAALGRSRRLRR